MGSTIRKPPRNRDGRAASNRTHPDRHDATTRTCRRSKKRWNCRRTVLVQRELETEGSIVSGFWDIVQGSVYGFTATMTSSRYGFLFSGSGSGDDAETAGHIDSSLMQRQTGVVNPKVEHVALGLTLRMKTLEHALAQVDRKRTMPLVRLIV